jgi:hypothetical protein
MSKSFILDGVKVGPNNPRFSELGKELNTVPDARFSDQKVQSNTFEKMQNDRVAVSELRDTWRRAARWKLE